MKKPIGIFGGTFDPIHNGHLLVAERVLQFGKFAEIKFVPCKLPVHKPYSHASITQRQQMLELAIASHKKFTIDTREINRLTPSYTIETLQSFRKEFPNTPLVLIIGMDSFLHLPEWKDWKSLINYAHILVISRPEFQLAWSEELNKEFKDKIINDINGLTAKTDGALFLFETDTLPISSTDIRQQIKSGHIDKRLMPEVVMEYIQKQKLY